MVTPRHSSFSVINCPMVRPLVSKHECVGHVQKRMGTALRQKAKEKFVNERGEHVRMRGKGRLTDKTIKLLTCYYGKAIRSNTGDCAAMQDAVWVVFVTPSPQTVIHSTSIAPVASGLGAISTRHLPIPSHSHPTHPPSIQTLFLLSKRSLSDTHPILMERCILGATQNQNESFNSMIWQHCPKTEFRSATTVEIVVNLAVISFNSGQVPFAKLQERLEATVSPLMRLYLSDKDHHRVSASVMKAEVLVKRQRRPTALGFSYHKTGRTHLRSSTTNPWERRQDTS